MYESRSAFEEIDDLGYHELYCVSPQKILKSYSSVLVVTLFGNSVFAVVIKLERGPY